MSYDIKDISLWESGETKIQWVKSNMDLLRGIEEEFEKTKPFAGMKIAMSIHMEAKTAYLCRVLQAGGADMIVTGSNPLSTQDDVAAAAATSQPNRKRKSLKRTLKQSTPEQLCG